MSATRPGRSRVGVDIGGTFIDLVLVDEATGAVSVGKLLTTPKEPAQAVEQGLMALAGRGPSSVAALIHGTTLGTNAPIERKGAIEERESTTVTGPAARVVVEARLTLIAEPAA